MCRKALSVIEYGYKYKREREIKGTSVDEIAQTGETVRKTQESQKSTKAKDGVH